MHSSVHQTLSCLSLAPKKLSTTAAACTELTTISTFLAKEEQQLNLGHDPPVHRQPSTQVEGSEANPRWQWFEASPDGKRRCGPEGCQVPDLENDHPDAGLRGLDAVQLHSPHHLLVPVWPEPAARLLPKGLLPGVLGGPEPPGACVVCCGSAACLHHAGIYMVYIYTSHIWLMQRVVSCVFESELCEKQIRVEKERGCEGILRTLAQELSATSTGVALASSDYVEHRSMIRQ